MDYLKVTKPFGNLPQVLQKLRRPCILARKPLQLDHRSKMADSKPLLLTQDGSTVLLSVIVHPNARRDAISGIHDRCLRIDIKANPERGEANAAVIRFLADVLSKPRSEIDIRHGRASRRKLLVLYNCRVCDIVAVLVGVYKLRGVR